MIYTGGSQPKQGGFLIVRLVNTEPLQPVPDSVATATAYVNATGYDMSLDENDGDWYTYIGLATDATLGDHPVEVWDGDTLLASSSVTVVDGAFDYVSFDLPPSSNDLLVDQAAIDSERDAMASVESVVTPTRYWSGPWIIPTTGATASNRTPASTSPTMRARASTRRRTVSSPWRSRGTSTGIP
jgi:hypothetical protein